jgi:hypothetical protein
MIFSRICQLSIPMWLSNLFKTKHDPAEVNFHSTVAGSNPPRQAEFEAILTLLREGALDIQCPARFGSNRVYYTFISNERQLIGGGDHL